MRCMSKRGLLYGRSCQTSSSPMWGFLSWSSAIVLEVNVEQLEQVDEMLLRRVLEVGSCCPKEMLYLETGATPIRFTIMQRRLMFLYYILNEEKKLSHFQMF